MGVGPPSPGLEATQRIVGVSLPISRVPIPVRIDAAQKLAAAAGQAIWIRDGEDVQCQSSRDVSAVGEEGIEQAIDQDDGVRLGGAMLAAHDEHVV